jgi:transcriptional regulator with XRE-family HTH domain
MANRDMNKLKGRLREKGLTYKEAAEYIGMGVNTLSDKLNGVRTFNLDEAELSAYFFGR